MLELWFIRHGETDWNRLRRWQGQSDTALNDTGFSQARALRPVLSAVAFDAVWSSDLARARQTIETALPRVEARLDTRLREMHFGAWEGRTWAELAPEEQARVKLWQEDPKMFGAPGGETWGDVVARVVDWATTLPREGRVAVTAHGGTIRAFMHGVAGMREKKEESFVVANASVSRVTVKSGGVELLSFNDVSHLPVDLPQ